MEIRNEIYGPKNAAHARKIANLIDTHPEQMEDLMSFFFSDNMRLCQTAAWSVGILAEQHPEMLYPYLRSMIDATEKPVHDAVVRNTLRAWQFMDIPEEYQGEIFELSFKYICDPVYPIAFRAFGMTVCFNIGKMYPELLLELKSQLQLVHDEKSAGIRARAKNTLRAIDKIL
jgi:hypothetical protein